MENWVDFYNIVWSFNVICIEVSKNRYLLNQKIRVTVVRLLYFLNLNYKTTNPKVVYDLDIGLEFRVEFKKNRI